MRYFKYIAILAVLFMTASCTESDFAGQGSLNKGDKIQIVGRVLPFTDCNVDSRSVKADNEINIACMSLVIFDNNGTCVHLEYIGSNNPVFVLEREELAEKYDLSNAKIYVFANTPAIQPGDKLSTSSSEADFLATANEVSGINIPKIGDIECFPMIGELTVNLAVQPENVLEIPLYALYAKIVMNIKVTPDQTVETNLPPRFIVEGYEVHNVAKSVDFNGGTINSSNDATEVLSETFEGSIEGINVAQGSTEVQFSFYLPERFLLPNTSAADYAYPFKGTDGTIREEDEKYRQRFKPCLVEATTDKEAQKATFVRFFGEFIDHQGHNYNVSYDIYVGNDNYSNFDVVRNTQYNNYITIRGLANSNDQATNEDAISIDHRVDVERVNPIIINFRRETLLDSHFEVRPLRIRKNTSYTGDVSNAKVKVEVLNAIDPDNTTDTNRPSWIRIEHNNGTGSNTDLYCANGKRLYFTYGLITGTDASGSTESNSLVNSHTISTIPVSATNECVWIYADETDVDDAADAVRSAIIRVSYAADGTNFSDPIDYVINQRELFPVSYTDDSGTTRSYNIEYHEEYLYNYDAEDDYGQTEYEGMAWGLDGVQLSFDNDALYFDSSLNIISWIINWLKSYAVDPKYDFYIPKHDTGVSSQTTKRAYSGYTFCDEIIKEVNGTSGQTNSTRPTDGIDILNLGQQPQSAIEYCYNKNKRNSNGVVTSVEWYLPAIDEIEDIVMSEYSDGNKTYSRFEEFQDKYYWSSQPSYIRNLAHYNIGIDKYGEYYYDDVSHARATKVNYSDSKYSYAYSGTEGYYQGIRIYSEDWSTKVEDITTNPYNGYTLGTLNRQPGNKSRTDMARIRCVRRIPTTTTTTN